MTDIHDKQTRSYNMSQIKSKDTKPEMLVRKYLFKNGFRYKLHDKKLPGKPDIVLPKYNTVIFINGCFWHGHKNCKYYVIPKTRTDWWLKKINKNKEVDKKNISILMDQGWAVKTIWECELKPDKIDKTLNNLLREFNVG
ncbi:MAG: DNA mismatch endonuclease Vsr [Candidatus Marinimicrobia bacterium]|nr:DNA mismatch endonuclease Vsr [Candidatus Neomarinimicrobiota bacterium]